MAQTSSNKMRIVAMTGVDDATTYPVTCPLQRAYTLRILNADASASLSVCTDDGASPALTLAATKEVEFVINHSSPGWGENEIACYVKGAVTTQPTLTWIS